MSWWRKGVDVIEVAGGIEALISAPMKPAAKASECSPAAAGGAGL